MQTHTNKQLRCDVSMTPPVVSELIGKWLPYTSLLSGTVGLPQPVRSSESRNAMDSGPAASGEVSAFFFLRNRNPHGFFEAAKLCRINRENLKGMYVYFQIFYILCLLIYTYIVYIPLLNDFWGSR